MKAWRRLKIILALAVCAAGCGAPKGEPTAAERKEEPKPAEVRVRGGRVYLADAKGERLWEAQAELMEGDFPRGQGRLLKVRCRLLENGKTSITASAAEASYRPEKREILLRGGVNAQWPEKAASLNAEQMLWALEQRTIEARGKVRLVHGAEHFQGSRLRADFGLNWFELVNGEE